uniref:Putative polyketide synthase n=1 Tax=Fusarium sp. NRRL 25184 TaxID=70751 RepID=A0A0U2KI57_9HYPO|nr:putative polyketide synthase [Fusarium sp. NRRL 25184]
MARATEPIAVVGMAIKVAGADDVQEFSQMLRTGESQHEVIGPDRFMFDTLYREGDKNPSRKWFGNFIRDADAFDHKFFKRSPRESATMDPQQRLFLQAAYQAVEQSGYFTEPENVKGEKGSRDKKHVGVYLGACAGDYEHHVACHPANAFTATGNLKSFIPGKVSHYFGWTGPSMTFDTACSASAVAIHTACNNLLSGECSAALAGGVATMTNFLWFQNLAGASFLSPSGQCKPFDDAADGYCRAEGIACVFLKRLSDALADGNPIFGCIASTAVYQNQNCTPLFVPNSPSLSQLFKDVISKAKLKPSDISLVEAHGTGTPVGDPAEYDSIRLAIGGANRDTALPIGSVKGHIGHTEGASGVVSLIKVLVMMQGNYIPSQASFSKMSSHITVTPSDYMEVVTSLREWSDEFKAALINNYGASGSNASMVVIQAPRSQAFGVSQSKAISPGTTPFRISGHDDRAIAAFCAKLVSTLEEQPDLDLGSIAINVNRQFNPALGRRLLFKCRSVTDLKHMLSEIAVTSDKVAAHAVSSQPERPVILCFGGQVSTYVGLDRAVYESVAVLRHYLDQCDMTMKSLGLGTIYPNIFMRTPQDTVDLQMILFALQYACAMAWLDSGVSTKVVALVGHSFGEITGLCVSGALDLPDAIKLVSSRARLVKDSWGADPGAMMAVEAEESQVLELLAESNQSGDHTHVAEIACYNGPRSFTLAGSTRAIERVAETIAKDIKFSSIRSKILNVTNAFHSSLVDHLTLELENVGKELTFKESKIQLERATRTRSTSKLEARFVAEHMRDPVYFNHAIQRLAQDYPSAIFLEAGSSSTITMMANRALVGQASSKSGYFQAMNITTDRGLENLTDATLSLWNEGLNTSFWMHHPAQVNEFSVAILPPYQFDKSRHWLELKSPLEAVKAAAKALEPSTSQALADHRVSNKDRGLWTLVSGQGDNPRFRIHTESDEYKSFISGHVIAQTAPICPATLMVDMAIEALTSLNPEWEERGLLPVISNMVNHSPLCVDPSLATYLAFEPHGHQADQWLWRIYSHEPTRDQVETHVEAEIQIRDPADKSYQAEFSRFERLVNHKTCTKMLESGLGGDPEGHGDILTGRNIYRTFSDVVDYGEMYRGVRAIIARGNECVGHVFKKPSAKTWLDVPLSDSFSQVGGIWANCMTDCDSADMFIATGCELSMRSPQVVKSTDMIQESWHVFARHTQQSEKLYLSDLLIFNASTGTLREVMLGIQYARVAKASMRRMLTRLTTNPAALKTKPSTNEPLSAPIPSLAPAPSSESTGTDTSTTRQDELAKPKGTSRPDITEDVKNLVANVAGIDAEDITLDAEMADFGIDSLMGMEIAREVQVVFKCTLDQAELMEATSLRKFVICISTALYGPIEEGATTLSADSRSDSTDISSDSSFKSNRNNGVQHLLHHQSPVWNTPPNKITSSADAPPAVSRLELSQSDILESFGKVKALCDQHLQDFKVDNIDREVLAGSSRLCVALVVEAFEELGVSLRSASAGQLLNLIPFQPAHGRLVEFIYRFLHEDARLIDIDEVTGQCTRTRVPTPRKTSLQILEEQLASYPEFVVANKLTYYAGTQLAGVLDGKLDGLRVIFGTTEGRELVQALYCDHTFNRMNYNHMRLVIENLVEKFRYSQPDQILKILEVGAGTGGTTHILAPVLEKLRIPVEYTFTDISGSMVANARRKFGKLYPFMRFAVHDIEKPPAEKLKGQHIIIGSNAVHATRNLVTSTANLRSALRSDGFLMMLEMTESVPFVDVIFGLLEGWWLFDDGRKHAIITAEDWERDLHSAGYGHVDWTDGELPENTFQKVIIALASGTPQTRLPKSSLNKEITVAGQAIEQQARTRQAEVEGFVTKYAADFVVPDQVKRINRSVDTDKKAVVILTGATGSLGSHLASSLASHDGVKTVVCINRRSRLPAQERQYEAFSSRGIVLSSTQRSKLRILEADTSSLHLGLSSSDYEWLVQNGTHIVHNAWPMSGTRPVKAFEPQFQSLRRLLDLSLAMAGREGAPRITFQFVSSIGVVGHFDSSRVPEQRVSIDAVLPIGYCEAKWACERLLDETLHKHQDIFRTMVVRPGQIAGSSTSGFWNPIEHFAFLVKSAQTLRAWPDFDGILQWVPVDSVANTMTDLLSIGVSNPPESYPVYHIDNPVGQPWAVMSRVLADALGIPLQRLVPFSRWVKLVRNSPLPADTWNPAARLIDFLDSNFERMSCGGLVLDTKQSKGHSHTLATQGPVSAEIARRYIASWKQMGFLNE